LHGAARSGIWDHSPELPTFHDTLPSASIGLGLLTTLLYRLSEQSCAPTNWWSAAALGGLLMKGGGGAPRIFHRRRCGFIVGGGGGGVDGIRPDERALKQRTRWTGVFFWFYRGQPLHL